MNAAYDVLRAMTVEQLKEAWDRAPDFFGFGTPATLYFRWQVDVTIERKLSGRWADLPPEESDVPAPTP